MFLSQSVWNSLHPAQVVCEEPGDTQVGAGASCHVPPTIGAAPLRQLRIRKCVHTACHLTRAYITRASYTPLHATLPLINEQPFIPVPMSRLIK